MNQQRFRLDLDGVELKDPRGRVVCILRWRTTQGLVLRLPESVDVVVPWRLVTQAVADLGSGALRVTFTEDAPEQLPWLRPYRELNGEWTDRHLLANEPS